MTTHRRPEIQFTDAPRGTCRWCGEDILFDSGDKSGETNKRRRWHPECVDVYNASDPREARRRVRKRDRGRCAVCRVDTYKVRRELLKIGRGRAKAIRAQGYKTGKSFWELDHMVPLIDGGSHEDDNLQTLCTPCHTSKTAEEARVRAQRTREEAGTTPAAVPSPAIEPRTIEQPAESKPVRTDPTPRKTRHKTLDELFEAADAVNARVKRVLADREPSRSSQTPRA